MLKVVFDTNVYISSYVAPNSKSEEIFFLAKRGKFKLFVSPAIGMEVANKLRKKIGTSEDEVQRVIRQIGKVAEVIKPQIKLKVLNDEPDNRILECAVAAEANIIITGDKHLLKLKNYEGIGIASVASFLYTLGK